LNKHHF